MPSEMPQVSVIIPCYNEEKYIREVIESILKQSYPKEELEVFFVDGQSQDGTREIIQQFNNRYPFIQLLDNPDRFVPQAMNRAIRASKGEIIVRLDAHADYPADYLEKLVYWLKKLEADNVGALGKTEVKQQSPIARAISKVLSHPLGVGNSQFRIGSREIKQVDTVPFGCFRRDVFDRFGFYDERLRRNQDIELNKRIIRGGGKIFLIPDIVCTYYARESLAALWKNNFANGEWVIRTAYLTQTFSALSIRHFVPLFFILYWIGLLLAGLFSFVLPVWLLILACLPGLLYLFAINFASWKMARTEKDFSLFLPLIASFFTLHFSYGLGSLKGLTRTRS
jgi:glycosyltransferase involved in cell wall biosynthesis